MREGGREGGFWSKRNRSLVIFDTKAFLDTNDIPLVSKNSHRFYLEDIFVHCRVAYSYVLYNVDLYLKKLWAYLASYSIFDVYGWSTI